MWKLTAWFFTQISLSLYVKERFRHASILTTKPPLFGHVYYIQICIRDNSYSSLVFVFNKFGQYLFSEENKKNLFNLYGNISRGNSLLFLYLCTLWCVTGHISLIQGALVEHSQTLLPRKYCPGSIINKRGNIWVSFDKILLDSFEYSKLCYFVHTVMTHSSVDTWETSKFSNFFFLMNQYPKVFFWDMRVFSVNETWLNIFAHEYFHWWLGFFFF